MARSPRKAETREAGRLEPAKVGPIGGPREPADRVRTRRDCRGRARSHRHGMPRRLPIAMVAALSAAALSGPAAARAAVTGPAPDAPPAAVGPAPADPTGDSPDPSTDDTGLGC